MSSVLNMMRYQYILKTCQYNLARYFKDTKTDCFTFSFNYLDVRIRGAAHVQGGQLAALDGRDVEGLRVEVILKLNNKNDNCR